MLTTALILAVMAVAVGYVLRQQHRRRTSTWAEAVLVTDVAQLARFQDVYNDLVHRIERVRPDTIQSPAMRVAIRIHPGPFPIPNSRGWGKVLAGGAENPWGDPYGTIVLRADKQAHFPHEAAHCITGISDHPSWLFKPDGTLAV